MRLRKVKVSELDKMKFSELSDDDYIYILDKSNSFISKRLEISDLKKYLGSGGDSRKLSPDDIFHGKGSTIEETKDAIAKLWELFGGTVEETIDPEEDE